MKSNIMKKPKYEDFLYPEEKPDGSIHSYCNNEDYQEALEKYIDYLENKDLKCKNTFDCGIEYCELKKCHKFEMK